MNFTRVEWLYGGATAAALGVAGALAWLWRTFRMRDAGEAERRRRAFVDRVGRIGQAEILEIVESNAEASAPRHRAHFFRRSHKLVPPSARLLVLYRYRVGGVTYETAQDISGFDSGFTASAAGQLVSVKYDPADPSNSILAAERWTGLRSFARNAVAPEKGS